MKMAIQACLLLFVPILCCSSIDAQPMKDNTSLSFLILKDHLVLRPNNVIQYIWQNLTTCSIKRPSDASLEDKAFLQFGFIPYLCVILYDASLRYSALNNSHVDSSLVNPDIVQKITNIYKPENFCKKMEENSWSTTIQENKLWVSHFNASMKKESLCKRYCVSDIVNPLCAFALWLDVSIKTADHAPNHTLPLPARDSPGVASNLIGGHRPVLAINNREPPNAAVEEHFPDSSGTQHFHAKPVGQSEATKLELNGAPTPEQNPAPSTVTTGSKEIVDPGSEHEMGSYFKATQLASVTKVGQPGSENIHGGEKLVNLQVPSPSYGNRPQNDKFTPKGSSYVPVPMPHKSFVSDEHTGPVEEHKNINKGISNQEQSTRGMEPVGTAPRTEGTGQISQEKEHNLKLVIEQSIGNHDVTEQTGMSEALKDPATVVLDGSDQAHKNHETDGEQSQNRPPDGDPMKSLHAENPKKPSEETTNRYVKENMKSTVPGIQLSQETEVVNGDETGKEQSSEPPPQIEQSNAAEAEQTGDEVGGPISGEPDDHEKQKMMEEVAVHSRGEDGQVVGSHRVLDQPQDADVDFGEQQEFTEETRFNGEGDEAQRPNASPKISDYEGGSDEDEDQIRVNEDTGKGQNDADAGMYVHDRFVDAEDSHFFAYFMTMIVLCIIGYLIFHNKQKILALALEGRVRKGSRRRPSTSGYRKLDSNLEEAVTSNCAGPSVTHVIY